MATVLGIIAGASFAATTIIAWTLRTEWCDHDYVTRHRLETLGAWSLITTIVALGAALVRWWWTP